MYYSIFFLHCKRNPRGKMTSIRSLECINSSLFQAVDGLSYSPANKCYNMLAEMLHCSFSPLWRQVFFQKVAQLLLSTVGGAELVIIHDGEYSVDREMSSGMCNQESFSPPKVCQCNAQSVCRGEEKKESVRQFSKMWCGVPRGCFGNNLRSRPCDFFKSWLTSGLSLVPPKISFKLSIRVTPVAYVAPTANLCLPVTDSSLERRRMLET